MKNILAITAALCFLLLITPSSFSHHMAEGMVDEEVYAMINTVVSDTPHVFLTFDEVPGMTVTTITAEAIKFLEDMIDDGLMDYFPMLDGEVTVTIDYNTDSRTAVMTVTQLEPEE